MFRQYLRSPQPKPIDIETVDVHPNNKASDDDYSIKPKSEIKIIPVPAKSLTEEIYSFAKTFIGYHQKFRSYLRSHPKVESEAEKIVESAKIKSIKTDAVSEPKLDKAIIIETQIPVTKSSSKHSAMLLILPKVQQTNVPEIKLSPVISKEQPKIQPKPNVQQQQKAPSNIPTQTKFQPQPKVQPQVRTQQQATIEQKRIVQQPSVVQPHIKVQQQPKIQSQIKHEPQLIVPQTTIKNTQDTSFQKPKILVEKLPQYSTATKKSVQPILRSIISKPITVGPIRENTIAQNGPKIKNKFSPPNQNSKIVALSPTNSVATTEPDETKKQAVSPQMYQLKKDSDSSKEKILKPNTFYATQPEPDENIKPTVMAQPTNDLTKLGMQTLPVARNDVSSKQQSANAKPNEINEQIVVAPAHQMSKPTMPVKSMSKHKSTKLPNLHRIAIEIQKKSSTKKQRNSEINGKDNVSDSDKDYFKNLEKLDEITEPDSDEKQINQKTKQILDKYGFGDKTKKDSTEDVEDEDEDGDDDDDDEEPLKKQPFVPPFPLFPEYDDDVQEPVDHELYENLALTNRSEL